MYKNKHDRIPYTQPKLVPADLLAVQNKPPFILTVDMEESFDWNIPETSEHFSGELKGLQRFHLACLKRSIKPLYLVTYQVLKNSIAVDFLRTAIENNTCEVGIHLHPWNTPPLKDKEESFQCNLSKATESEKLKSLITLFQQELHQAPKSHRAGRYGVDYNSLEILDAIGIKIDLSPSAGFDFSNKGGPSFLATENYPRWYNEAQSLLSIPVPSVLFARGPDFLTNNLTTITQKLLPCEPVRLSPEGNTTNRMKALTKRLIREKISILIVTVHSTSFEQDENPYSKGPHGVEHIMKTLFDYLDWCQNDMNLNPITAENLWQKFSIKPFNEGKEK